jgi:predicted acylesterase/phospholipase RssA
MAAEGVASVERERAYLAGIGQTGALPPANFLALSGGGDQGAFAAGFLKGWSESGSRPEFKVVTGISTGALIAPFAFLGSAYDTQLQDAYTNISRDDVYMERGFLSGLFSDGLYDTAPLRQMIERYFTPALLNAIAAEYRKGRLLFVGTTDLDAREPVIWNMTGIAASGDPDALELFRSVIMASTAIPGAFPPVMIDVTVGGRHYQEMHVDGGAATQVFLYPPTLNIGELSEVAGAQRQRTLYIIRNARLDPEWASVDRRTLKIAARAVSSLIQSQGIGDLAQIYLTTQRDGIDYNLIYIPQEFNRPRMSDFETAYMRALFAYGRQMAVNNAEWQKWPPGYSPAPLRPELAVAH